MGKIQNNNTWKWLVRTVRSLLARISTLESATDEIGIEWFEILTFDWSSAITSDNVNYMSSTGGHNNESAGVASAKPAWDETIEISTSYAPYVVAPRIAGTTLRILGGIHTNATFTGDVELHVMKATNAGMVWGTSANISLVSVAKIALTNGTIQYHYEVDQQFSIPFIVSDRFTLMLYNKATGVPVTIKMGIKLGMY